jgi:hypothetical protein
MRYEVPQFIDVEDKIFGPLTFRQFAYLTGGAGLCYLSYKLIPGIFAFLVIFPLAAFSVALAFIKVNEKPLIDMVQSALGYFLNEKLYLYHKETQQKKEDTTVTTVKHEPIFIPKLSESKLHDLSWGLDVLNQKQK